jgi:hypothetical protein
MVAALYVNPVGIYSTLAGVLPWGIPDRDAREYAGPHPIVAHPPCQRWGALGTPRPRGVDRKVSGKPVGEDGGCFAAALASLRQWGGVLEHPAESRAWRRFGLYAPTGMGWHAGIDGTWCGLVWQSAYGHRAPKPTWLLYVGDRPPLEMDTSRPDPGFRIERMGVAERERTPRPFAEYLVALARHARAQETTAA